MHTYGGMCHEHEGVILCIVASDAEGLSELRDVAMDHVWRPAWLQRASIVVGDVVSYRLWRGCLRMRMRRARRDRMCRGGLVGIV